jgi:hypothetical protein
MLAGVASLAAAEYWGPGFSILAEYLSSNFYRAAVQGRLLVKDLDSSSSSSSSGGGQQVLLFNTGLLTEAGQHVLMMFLQNTLWSGPAQEQHQRWVAALLG